MVACSETGALCQSIRNDSWNEVYAHPEGTSDCKGLLFVFAEAYCQSWRGRTGNAKLLAPLCVDKC